MKKINIFFTIISILAVIITSYVALTNPYVNPLSITMLIVLAIASTILHASKIK